MQMNFKSTGYSVKCQCGDLAKWQVIDDLGNETYLCERCFRIWEGKIK